jgi:hypothetical protein
MANLKRYHDDKPATGAERVARHREAKRRADEAATKAKREALFNLEMEITNETNAALSFIFSTVNGDDTANEIITIIETDPWIRSRIKEILMRRRSVNS